MASFKTKMHQTPQSEGEGEEEKETGERGEGREVDG